MATLFVNPTNTFDWKAIKTFHLRNQYNETLSLVESGYFDTQYPGPSALPNFLNRNYALTLAKFICDCANGPATSKGRDFADEKTKLQQADTDLRSKTLVLDKARQELVEAWQLMEFRINEVEIAEYAEQRELREALFSNTDLDSKWKAFDAKTKTLKKEQLTSPLATLADKVKKFALAQSEWKASDDDYSQKKTSYDNAVVKARVVFANTENALKRAQKQFEQAPNIQTKTSLEAAQTASDSASDQLNALTTGRTARADACFDRDPTEFCLPLFHYERLFSLPDDRLIKAKDKDGNPISRAFFAFATQGLTVGAVLWLYYYERMGIFKILGALMDDYNYTGKYTLSGSRRDKNGNANSYSVLMDAVCTLHRLGISSNLRDRVCTYQRVLGVSLDNTVNAKTERNEGFMQSFNKLIDYMLEYYKTKQLSRAINNAAEFRSSVATQTSIRDTINVLKQQFEPFQYGRNQINTFLGIATVHMTLCLLNSVRKEIGIPDQYERPEEFIPAAYDLLVTGRPVTLNETNRFIIHDNCASYGYRLLTDIETADLSQFSTVAVGGTLDLWLDDVEGWVEGYRNAYASLPERATALVSAN
ncbi:hypothetical protein [Spirosoma montaniterrae]|uniref:Uncharacterized protein n=1 Tax=Spirosoma montaniterrae TaxID=1178516 RepID=A0A1P9WT29_9BACT|nr:hypothetical protein [Spirosoma montaniterrae]AQG78535.1 hypothetical protein AWR27_03775 [Spirosoma montaniterrae]